MKIVAASIVRNSRKFIRTMIESVRWVDQIIVCDDHSNDETKKIINNLSKSIINLTLVSPFWQGTMMNYQKNGNRDISRELRIRNEFLKMIFEKFHPSVVVLIDADEIMSITLLKYIKDILGNGNYDSIALGCIHVYDKKNYIHVYETTWNGVKMIDPHVRVLTKYKQYQRGEYQNVPDCFIKPDHNTLCLDVPCHYHLKYIKSLKKINYSFRFLPKNVDNKILKKEKYLRTYRFPFPDDLKQYINNYFEIK